MTIESDFEKAASILKKLSIRKNFPLTADIHPSWDDQLDEWEPHKEHFVRQEHDLKKKIQQRHGLTDEDFERYLNALHTHQEAQLRQHKSASTDFTLKDFFPKISTKTA